MKLPQSFYNRTSYIGALLAVSSLVIIIFLYILARFPSRLRCVKQCNGCTDEAAHKKSPCDLPVIVLHISLLSAHCMYAVYSKL